MLSRTVIHGKRAGVWKTTMRSGPACRTSTSPTLTSPDVGASNPASMFSRVDLPQPLGPTRHTISWSAISRLTRSSARTSLPLPRPGGNSLETSRTTIFPIGPRSLSLPVQRASLDPRDDELQGDPDQAHDDDPEEDVGDAEERAGVLDDEAEPFLRRDELRGHHD